MRDNGLSASAYTSMGGIDPLVSEPVLAALAEAGIAAYAVTPGEPGPSGEAAATPVNDSDGDVTGLAEVDVPKKADVDAPEKSTPAEKIGAGLDEIFVDAGSAEQARGVIDRSAEDAEWKSLVEQFNAPSAPGHSDSPVPRWPVSEDVDENSYEPLIDVPAGLDVADTDDEPPEEPPARRDDPHDHYVPPEPPRGPRLDWISRAAWLGLLGGPALLILAALFDFGTGRITTLAVVGFIAGFLTLVIRMKDRLPPDDTPDDGAVV
ncbi:hypothetical protein [Kribbella monticola]|uniref:hypothetical protein n=1 Tax=Kribbella monticola TaxID=2185285 RepID=UPI000DD44A7C|nr:hypothetical protein [Kribbella monticola]